MHVFQLFLVKVAVVLFFVLPLALLSYGAGKTCRQLR